MAFHPRSQRKDKSWIQLPGTTTALTADTTVGPASIAFTGKTTVIRMLGEYIVAPTSAPVALDMCAIGVGIIVVGTDVVTTGGGALPDPISDMGAPWLYWNIHHFFFGTSDVDPPGEASVLRHSFDIRSMRKVGNDQSLIYVLQYSDIVGTPPMTFSQGNVRVLMAQ